MDALRAIIDYDFRDRLPEIGCPTLIVWGTDDMLVPGQRRRRVRAADPGSRKVVFEDTGHMAMIERPQTFNDCLFEFLASRTRRPPPTPRRGPRGREARTAADWAPRLTKPPALPVRRRARRT